MSDYPEFEKSGFCKECGFVVYRKRFRYVNDPSDITRATWYCSNSNCKRSKYFEASYFRGDSRVAFIPDWVNKPQPTFSDTVIQSEPAFNDQTIGKDELFADAARLIVQHQHGSTSLIQRKMKLGYARSSSIIDQLEEAGIVGPFTGDTAREVKIKDMNSLENKLSMMGF